MGSPAVPARGMTPRCETVSCYNKKHRSFVEAPLRGSFGRRSVNQIAQVVHHQLRSIIPKFFGVVLARDADHQTEVAVRSGLDPREASSITIAR